MGQTFFEARDLWATQVPYAEPDTVEPLVVTAICTLILAARLKIQSSLVCDATVTN